MVTRVLQVTADKVRIGVNLSWDESGTRTSLAPLSSYWTLAKRFYASFKNESKCLCPEYKVGAGSTERGLKSDGSAFHCTLKSPRKPAVWEQSTLLGWYGTVRSCRQNWWWLFKTLCVRASIWIFIWDLIGSQWREKSIWGKSTLSFQSLTVLWMQRFGKQCKGFSGSF